MIFHHLIQISLGYAIRSLIEGSD